MLQRIKEVNVHPQWSLYRAPERRQFDATSGWVFSFHLSPRSLANSMTNWVQSLTDLLLRYFKWEFWSLTITKSIPCLYRSKRQLCLRIYSATSKWSAISIVSGPDRALKWSLSWVVEVLKRIRCWYTFKVASLKGVKSKPIQWSYCLLEETALICCLLPGNIKQQIQHTMI